MSDDLDAAVTELRQAVWAEVVLALTPVVITAAWLIERARAALSERGET